MVDIFVAAVTLAPCKSYYYFFNLLIQNGNVCTVAELPCKNTGQVSPLGLCFRNGDIVHNSLYSQNIWCSIYWYTIQCYKYNAPLYWLYSCYGALEIVATITINNLSYSNTWVVPHSCELEVSMGGRTKTAYKQCQQYLLKTYYFNTAFYDWPVLLTTWQTPTLGFRKQERQLRTVPTGGCLRSIAQCTRSGACWYWIGLECISWR